MSDLTFVEKDVTDMRDFINLVAKEAQFSFSTEDAYKYVQLYTKSINILKKMEAHIFELKEVIEPKEVK